MATDPDTYGWDTVFAISIDYVNQALALLPPPASSFSATGPIGGSGTATLAWNFIDWQIIDTPGGAEMVVAMRFGPGSQLTLSPGGTFDLSLPGYLCTVTFEAFFSDGRLVANTGNNQSWAEVVVSVPDPPNFNVELSLGALLTTWFQGSDALNLFNQEFMKFDMSADIGENELPWLIPKSPLGYAGALMADGVTKAIGILAMTNGDSSTAPGELKLSPYAIPANAVAGFVISRELVMTNMMMPAVAGAFSMDGKGDLTNFELSQQTFQLTNIGNLAFQHELDGVEQPCSINSGNLKLWQEGDRLYMTIQPMTMNTSLAGLLLDAKINETLEMSLVPKPNVPDAKIFMLSNVDPETPDVNHHYTSGATIAAAVVGAIVAAAGIALSVISFKGTLLNKFGLTAQSAKIWARVIAAIVAGIGVIIAVIPTIIAAALDDKVEDIPDIGPIISTSLDRITWPAGTKTKFVATEGRFANGILLTVDPQLI